MVMIFTRCCTSTVNTFPDTSSEEVARFKSMSISEKSIGNADGVQNSSATQLVR